MARKKSNKSKTPVAQARPSKTKKPFSIGFDLGGTKMLACVLDAQFKVLATARKATNGSEGAERGMRRIISAIEEAIKTAGLNEADLNGIGIGCPGLVNPAKGTLIKAPNLGWENVGLRNALKRRFKCPVAVLNDVDAGSYGEYVLGAGKGARSMLAVFPGTGVGAGFVYDGQLVRGKSVSCMELGMILLPGTHIGSAEFGLVPLEDLTSRLALAAQAGVACYRGQLPELDEKTGGALRQIRSKALASAVKLKEEAAVTMFNNSLRYLALGVGMVVNLMAPDRIVLGGGLVEEMPKLYLDQLKLEVQRFVLPGLAKGLKYAVAKLGGNAVAIGASAYQRKFGEG
jgi:glucokinase